MRQSIPFLALFLTSLTSVSAGPLPRNAAHDYNGAGYLLPRNCEGGWCGWAQDFCCDGSQVCVTEADIAKCGAATALAAVDGGWAFYTTTYVETVDVPVTKVATLSSYLGNVAIPSTFVPQHSIATCRADQISCAAVCCDAATEVCWTDGQCKPKGGRSDTFDASYLTPVVPVTSFTAPVRPTSLTVTTVPITTTQPFLAPVQTTGGVVPLVPVESGGGGLSPGAIAGIVIGTIAAIIILLLLLACCLLGTGIKGLLGLFGKKKQRSRSSSPHGHRTEIYEERRTTQRVGGAAAGARYSGGSRWFGGAAAAPVGGRRTTITQTTEKRRTGVGKEAALAGVGLGALWAGLKWKRKRDVEKRRPASSHYSYSNYTGSSSDATSVPRTHRSHRTGTVRTGSRR